MINPIIREIRTKNIITKSDLPVCDYSVNPYIGCTHGCMYCYASFMKRFTGHTEPWGTFLDVKTWPEIRNPQRYAGKELFIGSVTDPYLPEGGKYRRTRALLEQLRGNNVKISIATKSDLILRDLDLIRTFPDAHVSWSVNTLDEDFKDDMDNAASIKRRACGYAGIPQGRYPHHLFYLPHIPRHHGCESHNRQGKRALQSDLAGEPQSAWQL